MSIVISMFAHENDRIAKMHHREMKKWMRHTAMVPKGFIRYHVLEALKEKPMSGSEITEQIEKHTSGHWKPSPGSIYPLLSLLQEKGYIKELPTENGLKRYELTESGKSLFEEQKKIRKKFREETGFLQTPFFENFITKIPSEKTVEIRDSMKRLGVALFHLGTALQEKYSEQAVNESLRVVNEMAGKLEEINKKVKGEQNE